MTFSATHFTFTEKHPISGGIPFRRMQPYPPLGAPVFDVNVGGMHIPMLMDSGGDIGALTISSAMKVNVERFGKKT